MLTNKENSNVNSKTAMKIASLVGASAAAVGISALTTTPVFAEESEGTVVPEETAVQESATAEGNYIDTKDETKTN